MGTSVTIPIGTSDPVDLSQGLPLFPGLGTARAGISASSRSYKLFEIPILIICTRLRLAVYAGYGFGIVGPAIAFLSKNVNVARDNNRDGKGELTLTFNDGLRMEAGAFVGAYVSAGVSGALDVYLPRPWWKVWAFTWRTVFTFEKEFKVDLLALMFKLISYLLAQKPNGSSIAEDRDNKLQETKLDVKGFSMLGTGTGVTRNLRATPEVTAPLNLANYVPKLREINLGLAKVGGEISFGPTAHLQYPVTFNFVGFTVRGGVVGADEADYETVEYRNGNQVTARGDREFNTRENPTRFTTRVKYETTVKLAISIHARVKVAKFFSIGENTPSLDLTNLLYRVPERNRAVEVPNSVATEVGGGCVLTPNMTLRFIGPAGPEIRTGEVARGTVTIAGFQSPSPINVSLEIQPPVANFPRSLMIPAGSRSVEFAFAFQNQCMLTGNRDNPTETAPPSAITPLQNYRVRAWLPDPPQRTCSDYQAESPLSITNRFLRCQIFRGANRGVSPPWDDFASAKLIADIDNPGAPDGSSRVPAVLWFPYVGNEQQQPVPVTFTLLNENREPYSRSDVELVVGVESKVLAPSCTFNVTPLTEAQVPTADPSFSIHWKSRGQPTGYPNRFYLLVNAGCQYGQSEFWLEVYNWS